MHEAGHAVGRYLTAADIGYAAEEAIDRIDIGDGKQSKSIDGAAMFVSQATTYGPMLSRELDAVVRGKLAGNGEREVQLAAVAGAIATARAQGADVPKWLRARLLYILLGPAAEAKHSGRAIADVFASYENQTDRADAVRSCRLAGITDVDEIRAHVDEAQDRAAGLVERPEIWRAILALADALPNSGQFNGEKAAKIICAAIEQG
jgi:hypothetical protein